jgi:hypothetical protein
MSEILTKEAVSIILSEYYSGINSHKEFVDPINADSIFNTPNGLGDSLILSSVIGHKKVNNKLLEDLGSKFNLFSEGSFTNDLGLDIAEISNYNWGGGHCTQRIQRGLGLPVSTLPKPYLGNIECNPFKGYVFVHMENNTDWKRNLPNSLNGSIKDHIKSFFYLNEKLTPYYFDNNLPLPLLFSIMSKCEYFLGIDSGPMHLASALGLKSIIIINNPDNNIYLPKIKECDIPNSEWLYPQNVHLNSQGENPLVPEFSIDNLSKAFNGEVYPYFSQEYLPLYFEANLEYR